MLYTQFCFVIIWLAHSFVLWLFGYPSILSCVYFLSIWLSHNFILCLFCIDSTQGSIILCWKLTVVTDLYSLVPVSLSHTHTHTMFPAVDWTNYAVQIHWSLQKKNNNNNLFLFYCGWIQTLIKKINRRKSLLVENFTGLSWTVQFDKKCIVSRGLSNKPRRVHTKTLFGAATQQE